MNELKHWFAFVFHTKTGAACTYTGYKTKNITMQMIYENKVYAEATEDSVLANIIYLGEMAKDEFIGKNNIL